MARELKEDLGIAQVPRTANNSIITYLILLLNYSLLHLAIGLTLDLVVT